MFLFYFSMLYLYEFLLFLSSIIFLGSFFYPAIAFYFRSFNHTKKKSPFSHLGSLSFVAYFFCVYFKIFWVFLCSLSHIQTHIKRFTLSFWLFNHFHRGLMPVHTTTPSMTRHTFTTNHSNNPMLSSPLFPRKSLDTAPTVPVSPRFTRRPFPNKASPGL